MATSSPTASVPAPASDDTTIRYLLDLARPLAIVLALLAGVLFLVSAAFFLIRIAFGVLSSPVGAVYWLIAAVVNYLIWKELPSFQALAAQRQYGTLKDRVLIWAILGLVFFLIEGILLLLVFIKLETTPVSAAPAAAAPDSPASPPSPPAGALGVTASPAGGARFCAQCGGPLTYPEPGRAYCARCARYV